MNKIRGLSVRVYTLIQNSHSFYIYNIKTLSKHAFLLNFGHELLMNFINEFLNLINKTNSFILAYGTETDCRPHNYVKRTKKHGTKTHCSS